MSHALIHPLVPLRERPQHFLEKLKKYKTLKVSREVYSPVPESY